MTAPQTIVTTSWDDGHPRDVELAELLSELGIRGTFYVAPQSMERPPIGTGALRELAGQFEIGAHSVTHSPLTGLAERELRREVCESKHMLEDVLGSEVSVFCYPRGHYNRRVRRAVMDAGFRCARTTTEFHLDAGDDPWRMPTTLQAYPHPLWMRVYHGTKTLNWRGLASMFRTGPGKSWVALARAFFERALARGGVWHLWGHSWEIEEQGLWEDLRTVLGAVSRHPGVQYLANGQLVSCVEAGNCATMRPGMDGVRTGYKRGRDCL
jgi:hypothetical protein